MNVILADHHLKALWALKTMLKEEPEFNLLGEAEDGEHLLLLANEQNADLILIDRGLPGVPIVDLVAGLHEGEPKPIVIVMSSNSEDSRMALRAGADAFVSKGDQPEWLLTTLRKYANKVKVNGEAE